MVRATIFVSALFALVATVAAVPTLVRVTDTGIGKVNAEGLASDILNQNKVKVNDVLNNANVANGILHKRGEVPAGTVRIARENKDTKMMNKKGAKRAAAAAKMA